MQKEPVSNSKGPLIFVLLACAGRVSFNCAGLFCVESGSVRNSNFLMWFDCALMSDVFMGPAITTAQEYRKFADECVADIIRERANRLFAKAAAAREQGKIEHALKLANLASHVLNEAAAAEASAAPRGGWSLLSICSCVRFRT
jgi:hypothetical protein